MMLRRYVSGSRILTLLFAVFALAMTGMPMAEADEDALTLRGFEEDRPTLTCLGFAWRIEGDANRNATAAVRYRKQGAGQWQEALPLLRTGDFHVGRTSDWLDHKPPAMLAGSILDLEPDTAYEVRINVRDPDGLAGESEKLLRTRTRPVPAPPEGGKIYHLYPPGHRARWPENEFSNLYKAYYGGIGNLGDFNMVWERTIKPGDTILVHAGVYRANLKHYTDRTGLVPDGTYWLTAKGTAEKPITIKAAGDGPVVFDGAGCEVLFNVMAADYHIFEGLTFRNCGYAILAGQQRVTGCKGLTVRNCRFENVRDGIYTLWNGSEGFYIADNVILGRNERDRLTNWGGPAEGYLKSNTAITLQGTGHVVCRNAIAFFWQGYHMGTAFQGWDRGGVACDIYENDFYTLIDDGAEVDGCVRNIRVLRNRFVNTGSPISAQPVYGGPVYFIRNVAFNGRRGLKYHEAHPSGLLTYHNTLISDSWVGRGLYTNAHFRNNLYLAPQGTGGRVAFPEPGPQTTSDYNGYGRNATFATTPLDGFAPIMDKSQDPWWPLKKYPPRDADKVFPSFDAFRKATGHEEHGLLLDASVFARLVPGERQGRERVVFEPAKVDFSLNPAGAAVDAGVGLPNVNDGYGGAAPDLGALEAGQPAPHYGPSWVDGDFDFTRAYDESKAADALAPPLFEFAGDGLTVEAEDCLMEGFETEKSDGYSGGQIVKLAGTGGKLLFRVKAVAGGYLISVTYCDENDGRSPYMLLVDGREVARWVAEATDGGPGKEPQSLRTKTVEDVQLNDGSTVELRTERNVMEFGRVDCFQFAKP